MSPLLLANGFVMNPPRLQSTYDQKKEENSRNLHLSFPFMDVVNSSSYSLSSNDLLHDKKKEKIMKSKISRYGINRLKQQGGQKRTFTLNSLKGKESNTDNGENENKEHIDTDYQSINNNLSKNVNIYEKLLIICGPSGVGKSTLIKRLMTEYPTTFGFSISHTTRLPRPGEVEGVDYYYISKSEFLAAIDYETGSDSSDNQIQEDDEKTGGESNQELHQEGERKGKMFLEYARVHGNLYGTSFNSILDLQKKEKIGILDIDVQGVKNIKKQLAKHDIRKGNSSESITISNIGNTQQSLTFCPIYLFVAPPNISNLEERLRGRNTEDEEALARRLNNAKKEVEYGHEKGNFNYILVNDEVEESYKRFKDFIRIQYGDTIFDV